MARFSSRYFLHFRNANLANLSISPAKSVSSSTTSESEIRGTNAFDVGVSLLGACRSIRQLLQSHARLIISGLFNNFFVASHVLVRSVDFCQLDYTILIFQHIKKPDTFCVNTVVKAYSLSSIPQEAFLFYHERLKNGFIPNSYTFVPLFTSCAKMRCLKSGQKYHGQALKNGVYFVLPVQNSLIHMYGCFGLDECMKVFVEMKLRDSVSWNSIVSIYCRSGDLDIAHKMFDLTPDRNIISWNAMITGYLKAGNPGFSLKLFREMANNRLGWSSTTLVSVLTACGRSARLKEGKSLHGFLIRSLIDSSIVIDTALIDMYSKCKKVELASKIFDKMSYRNLVCWNAMILGHCMYGNPEEGLSLFVELVDQSKHSTCKSIGSKAPEVSAPVIPDEITFIGVLNACARSRLLAEGKHYFREMIDKFDIKPNFAHLWCMANLFITSGLVKEAEDMLRSLPEDDEDTSPESLMWANLFGLCRFRGDVSLGERIAKSLIEEDPENFQNYRLLINVYAVAGQWEDVERVKRMLKERGVRRTPGCTLKDLKELVHEFQARNKFSGEQVVEKIISELS